MTGDSVRDIGFLAWENDLAWMEHMKGKKWNDTLRKERTMWNALTKQKRVADHAAKFHKEFTTHVVPRLTCEGIILAGVIGITLTGGYSVQWQWLWSDVKRTAQDIDSNGTHVWVSETDPKNSYKTIITCETLNGEVLWTKTNVSSEIVIQDGYCYFIRIKYPFETSGIYRCDAYTGRKEERIFEELDTKRFLGISKCSDGSVYVSSGTWDESKLWQVKGTRLIRKYPDSTFQYPLDENNAFLTDYTTQEMTPHGKIIESWHFPPKKYQIKWANIKTGHILTAQEGEQIIWHCGPKQRPTVIYRILAGEIQPTQWAEDHGEEQQHFFIRSPYDPPWILHVIGSHALKYTSCKPPKEPFTLPKLTATRFSTSSADGTRVSYLLVHAAAKKPTKLLAYIYGAYGSDTVVMWPYMHWAPLFSHGWAVAYSYPRGGGDRNVAWMKAGQARNHIKTIEDFEGIIRDAQRRLRIKPEKTAIYGRSAGGLMVGGTTARNPDGGLMGATYTEVPFVDAIRSQTNPDIPLVNSGMSEYGNPIESPIDFSALLSISPMNSLPADGAPGVFVLCRTGLKDLQVLPFEPVKWIQRLRGEAKSPAGKYLAYEEDQAHVYSGPAYYKARAIDLAVLDLWAEKALPLPK